MLQRFILYFRYQDGKDHMGEHKDDEKELIRHSPIASLSLGQARDFVFRHECARGSQSKKNKPQRDIAPVKIELQHGSLLMMNYPTNCYWYHSLPQRKKLPPGVRVNMTFRDMVTPKWTFYKYMEIIFIITFLSIFFFFSQTFLDWISSGCRYEVEIK